MGKSVLENSGDKDPDKQLAFLFTGRELDIDFYRAV
jgi:hypothetical protein